MCIRDSPKVSLIFVRAVRLEAIMEAIFSVISSTVSIFTHSGLMKEWLYTHNTCRRLCNITLQYFTELFYFCLSKNCVKSYHLLVNIISSLELPFSNAVFSFIILVYKKIFLLKFVGLNNFLLTTVSVILTFKRSQEILLW